MLEAVVEHETIDVVLLTGLGGAGDAIGVDDYRHAWQGLVKFEDFVGGAAGRCLVAAGQDGRSVVRGL